MNTEFSGSREPLSTVTSTATPLGPATAGFSAPVGRSLWDDAFARLRRNRMAMACLAVLALIIVAAIVVPFVSPYNYYTPEWTLLDAPPSLHTGHILGTDDLGRDMLVRVMWGCRVSLMIGIVASLVSVVIGVVWGATAGYKGGPVDAVMMRLVDILYAVPFIPFVIVLVVLFGRNILLIFVAIGAVSWLDIARIVRGQTLTLRNKEFVEAARASGVSGTRIVTRHLIPNLLGIVVIYATLTVPSVILFEAFLSFLGLGVQAPMTSLGVLVSDGAGELQVYPYLLLIPAVFLALIVYCLNFLGDGLSEALDPKGAALMAEAPLLETRKLHVEFDTRAGVVHAVSDVNLTLAPAEVLAIVGESGSGKSQMLLAMLGLSAQNARVTGSVRFLGDELLGASEKRLNQIRGQQIGFVFQDPMTSLNPYLSIGLQLTEPLRVHRRLGHSAAAAQAVEMLKAVHISEPERRMRQFPHQLSGGMRQRVAIAMALICGPKILIADEPTTALDVTVQAQVLALLREVRERFGTAVILVTHDLGVIAELADRVNVMYAGRVVEAGTAEDIFYRCRHPYTEALERSVPQLSDDRKTRLLAIEGNPPDLAHLPPGCAFAPRCGYRLANCDTAVPPLEPVGGIHVKACIYEGQLRHSVEVPA